MYTKKNTAKKILTFLTIALAMSGCCCLNKTTENWSDCEPVPLATPRPSIAKPCPPRPVIASPCNAELMFE